MANIEITETELVWPGKHEDDGRLVEPPQVNLPFQVVTVSQGRAHPEGTRRGGRQTQAGRPLRPLEGRRGEIFKKGWKSRLISGLRPLYRVILNCEDRNLDLRRDL